MPRFLDLDAWPRRATFEYFRRFDKPYFNVCTRLDVARLKPALAATGAGSFSLACTYLALRLANEHEPFRYRLRDGRVEVLDALHAGITVLRTDDSIAFAYLPWHRSYRAFAAHGAEAAATARDPAAPFDPRLDDPAVVHMTTLPWIHFTSFSHARNWQREDAVPKIAFGRVDADGARLWMPFSVEVHHALMDGLHVGRYVEAMEAALAAPEAWLEG